ncbi:helix-turn-helix domain-containing protein [Endozoicomonas ascidiicola]|uniref:helix-turn-helix domain-containing protein n=1 Tax=Endozoicomonas ascidiicola TaxID=1698521 RepID=UPI00082A35B4|nr:helix-turn-helix transcriptional regulator [Endozoicomonas ascidiicola]
MAGSTDYLPGTAYKRLRFARNTAGLSQKQLAQMMNRSLSAVKEWEKDSYPKTMHCIERLCEILDISMDWYIRGIGQMRSKRICRIEQEIVMEAQRLTDEEKALILSVAKRMIGAKQG